MLDNFWQNYHFRIEPWNTDFDAPINIEELDCNDTVDPFVESTQWTAYKPQTCPPCPNKIIFVDGRRRLDARLYGREGNQVLYGAFATIAVGLVLANRLTEHAICLASVVRRVIALGGNHTAPTTMIPCPLGSNAQLIYDFCLTSSENDPQTPLILVQKAMLIEEAKLAVQFADDPDVLVIRDGPLLHSPYKAPAITLGYVKTMGKVHLPPDCQSLLWQLELGERTPIFAIGEVGHPKRHWSWYVRSGQPDLPPKQLGYHDLHGIVRLDLYAEVPLTQAIEIADLTTFLIPQYASHPLRDARAPQNLTPIGGLEKELGRLMGNKAVIERRLRTFLAKNGGLI